MASHLHCESLLIGVEVLPHTKPKVGFAMVGYKVAGTPVHHISDSYAHEVRASTWRTRHPLR